MPSDTVETAWVQDFADTAFVAALSFLRRCDYTRLSRIGDRILSAKDGKRDVIVWIDFVWTDSARVFAHDPTFVCPTHVAFLAKAAGARVDVVRITIKQDGRASIELLMNALERP